MKTSGPKRKSLHASILLLATTVSCAENNDGLKPIAECGAFFLSYSMFLSQEDEYANRQAESIGVLLRSHPDYDPDKLVGLVDEPKFADAAYANLYADGVITVNAALAEAAPDIVPDDKAISEARKIKTFCDELIAEKGS